MPFIAEHFSVINPLERLLPHNIGFKREISGLFLKYSNKLTLFRTNNSIRWEITAAVVDFAIDLKSGLLFYTMANTVRCISLNTGEQIWSKSLTGADKIACSPKHKLIYVTVGGTVNCYDYNLVFVQTTNMGNTQYKPAVLDKFDLVVTHSKAGGGTSTNRRRVLTPQLTNIATVSDNLMVNAPTPFRKQDGKVFWSPGAFMYYSDVVNSPSIQTHVPPVINADGNGWTRGMTKTVDGQFAYFLNNRGDSVNTHVVYKVDIVNGLLIWQKNVGTLSVAQPNQYSLTQDVNNLYVAINPRATPSNVVKEIIVLDKITSNVTYLPFNPNTYANDADIQVYHTYDIPI